MLDHSIILLSLFPEIFRALQDQFQKYPAPNKFWLTYTTLWSIDWSQKIGHISEIDLYIDQWNIMVTFDGFTFDVLLNGQSNN